VVRSLEGRPLAYLGLIGSRRKIEAVRENLLRQGVSQSHLDRVFQPVGLPIGAETPEEIAVSILSEIIAVHRERNWGSFGARSSTCPVPVTPGFEAPGDWRRIRMKVSTITIEEAWAFTGPRPDPGGRGEQDQGRTVP
jgi:hypothetical protein